MYFLLGRLYRNGVEYFKYYSTKVHSLKLRMQYLSRFTLMLAMSGFNHEKYFLQGERQSINGCFWQKATGQMHSVTRKVYLLYLKFEVFC